MGFRSGTARPRPSTRAAPPARPPRPLHESLSQALGEREAAKQAAELDELDPLKRFSSTGHLLARAKQVSLALAGLHSRLERPAANEEALEWRLTGPFGPRAIAE